MYNKELLQMDIKKTTDKMGKSDEIIEEQIQMVIKHGELLKFTSSH